MSEKHLLRQLVALGIFLMLGTSLWSQEKPAIDHSYKPLTLKLSDDGSKYVRFIIWHQQWAQTNNLAIEDSKLQVTHFARRSRFLAYAQISPRFLILTHFGLNNFTPTNMTSLGNNGDGPQMFLHDAWTEFKVSHNSALYIGGGLHYWKGLTRLASQSTLNFMTLDAPRPFVHWHSLGITDQFARHFGIYAKGALAKGKLDYRFAVNNPGRNAAGAIPLNGGGDYSKKSNLLYTGVSNADKEGKPTGNTIIEGYARYNLWDKESIVLPFNVGTYLGSKKILALGAGFFNHANGMYDTLRNEHGNISHFAVDAFLDIPAGKGGCLNAYASFLSFDYGENYVSRWAGTGSVFYGQVGFLLPGTKLMPYVAIQSANYDGFDDPVQGTDIGLNYFINGHNAKLTLEYHQIKNDTREGGLNPDGVLTQLRLQAHIFL
ncbi:MAG TPA: porin [Saprospiraceae bacterium]|nr:porin [Saprospiraceae bacterium]HMQ84373.1 porin [Saprospiraceae bacterium]